jgi:hypothetical protein
VPARVAGRGATVCLTDTTGAVPRQLPPGPIAYVRLRAERYDEEQREGWRALVAREAEHRPVMAFARHEGLPADDPGCGVGLAQWLLRPPPT